MILNIKRFSTEYPEKNSVDSFEITNTNLLKALVEIKTQQDSSLTFRCGCKSGVCGSCAVKVNGVERLACKTNIQNGDLIEPIKNSTVIKDLVVNVSHETLLLKRINSSINIEVKNDEVNQEDIKKIDLQSNCILILIHLFI